MLFVLDQNNQVSQLNDDLKNFGLNPIDWKVLREREEVYKIQSKQDQDFVFRGKAQRKGRRLKWEKLELVSL